MNNIFSLRKAKSIYYIKITGKNTCFGINIYLKISVKNKENFKKHKSKIERNIEKVLTFSKSKSKNDN